MMLDQELSEFSLWAVQSIIMSKK